MNQKVDVSFQIRLQNLSRQTLFNDRNFEMVKKESLKTTHMPAI